MAKERNLHYDPNKKNILIKYLSIVVGVIFLLNFIAAFTEPTETTYTMIGVALGKIPYLLINFILGVSCIWSGVQIDTGKRA
jgi:hypothetical protein